MKKDYQIKIKIRGEGTPDEIVSALRVVAEEIRYAATCIGYEAFDDKQWEDSVLVTEINLID